MHIIFKNIAPDKKLAPKPNTREGLDRNQAKAKAGLNKSILDKVWQDLYDL